MLLIVVQSIFYVNDF